MSRLHNAGYEFRDLLEADDAAISSPVSLPIPPFGSWASELNKVFGGGYNLFGFASISEFYFGLSFYLSNSPSWSDLRVYWNSGGQSNYLGAIEVHVFTDPGTGLRCQVASTVGGNLTVVASGATAVSANTWHHLEGHVVIGSTTGLIEAKLNGVSQFVYSGATDVGGNTTIDSIEPHSVGATNSNVYVDNVIVNNTAGGSDNSWPGRVYIGGLIPSAAGPYTSMSTLVGAATQWETVDEAPPDDDTSYVADTVAGNKSAFGMADPPSLTGWVIGRAWVDLRAAQPSTSTGRIATFLQTAGTDFEGSAQSLTSLYGRYIESYKNNPQSGAGWNAGELTSLSAGAVVRGTGSVERRVTGVRMMYEVTSVVATVSSFAYFQLAVKVFACMGNVQWLLSSMR